MYFVDRSVVSHIFSILDILDMSLTKFSFFLEFVGRPQSEKIPPLMMCLGFEKNRDVPGFSLNLARLGSTVWMVKNQTGLAGR